MVTAGGATAAEERATELLRSVGQRVTRPRVAVLSCVLAAGEQHQSADEILDRVVSSDAKAHRATVYRTLEGLAEAGVLSHVHLGRGLTAYHVSASVAGLADSHLHAQCIECRRVVDLPSDILGETAAKIRRASGFHLDPAHVALSGICDDCHKAGRSAHH